MNLIPTTIKSVEKQKFFNKVDLICNQFFASHGGVDASNFIKIGPPALYNLHPMSQRIN